MIKKNIIHREAYYLCNFLDLDLLFAIAVIILKGGSGLDKSILIIHTFSTPRSVYIVA
jgi:hypothetical protein